MRIYMKHGLKDTKFYVQKRITPLAICYNLRLVRDKALGAPAYVSICGFTYMRFPVPEHQN